MSNDPITSTNEQLAQTASPAPSTQPETRRDDVLAGQQQASRSSEEFTLSSLEGAASPLVADGKRPLEAPAPIADARQSQDSGAVSKSFTPAAPADKADDLADLPKGASSQYREKYAAVMREFRDGKLKIVVKDRSVAIAIAAEQATRIEAGPQQKQGSSSEQKQASSTGQKQASNSGQKQASSPEQKQASSSGQKQASSPEQKQASSTGQKQASSPEHKQASSSGQKQASSPEQKQASSSGQKQASSPEHKQASSSGQKQASSPEQKQASSTGQKQTSSPEQKQASSTELK